MVNWYPIALLALLSACGDKEPEDTDQNEAEDVGTPSTWYRDADGDGFGDPNSSVDAVHAPADHVDNADDCDDSDPDVHPNVTEICNDGIDDDCNGLADDADDGVSYSDDDRAYVDVDGDGYGGAITWACDPEGLATEPGDCDKEDPDIHPGMPEDCSDGVDQDCDDLVDCADVDCESACPETCDDGMDNDGDGLLDCEDGECVGADACLEQVGTCNDGKDNDLDGRRDCRDDDCWALGLCADVQAWVTDTDALAHTKAGWSVFGYTPGGLSYSGAQDEALVFNGLRGQMVVARGSGSSTCGWGVDTLTVGWAWDLRSGSIWSYDGGTTRSSGFAADTSCAFDGASIVPQELGPDSYYRSPSTVVIMTSAYWDLPFATATGWGSTTSWRTGERRTYPGTDGYGGTVQYSTSWWSWERTRRANGMQGGGTWVFEDVYVGAP